MNEKLKILFIGDVVGRVGLDFLKENIQQFIEKYNINFIIVNGENVTHGKGITEEEAEEIFGIGADVITTGNHIWENWKSRPLLAKTNKIIRPFNYPQGNPGLGFTVVDSKNGHKVGVLQIQGRTFMQSIDCPFRAADHALKIMQSKTSNIIVDFHADATAEKMTMGWHLDGRVSALIGTHTHIQTADAMILPKGTAYLTDVGMTGPYDSVVGMRKDVALKRFILQTAHKYEMGTGDLKISAAVVEIDPETGQAMSINPFVYPDFVRSLYEQA